MRIGTNRSDLALAEQHFVALYHPKDGRVVHLHMVHVLKGGRSVSRAQAEEEARAQAKACGHNLADLEQVYTERLPEGGNYFKVDLRTRTLIAAKPPTAATLRDRERAGNTSDIKK